MDTLELKRNEASDSKILNEVDFKQVQTYSSDIIEIQKDENDVSDQDIYEVFVNSGIEYTGKIYVGLCFGVLLDEDKIKSMSYEKYLLLKFSIYQKIKEIFSLSKTGFVVKKEDSCCSLIAVISEEDRECFIDKYIMKARSVIKEEDGIDLHIGIGTLITNTGQMILTCETAKCAYDLYFFEEQDIIDYKKIGKVQNLSFEVYEPLMEEVYNYIVAKDQKVYEKIDNVLDAIKYIHYGNKYAAINRCIMFIGELGKRLKDLNPKAANWRTKQEEMQEILRGQNTYSEVKSVIMDFYQYLIPVIYHNVDQGNVYEVIQIKDYIRKNYMRDLTLKEMADLMYVSHSYFSTSFRNATGKNFKAYLTEVRMEEALKLVLRTNLKTYEIAEAVGYNNVRIFVDSFKNAYKMSPLEYRKVHAMESCPKRK